MKQDRTELRMPSPKRRGLFSIELVMTLPVLGLILFGLLEFSLLFSARGSVVEASRAGARKGTIAGTTPDDIEAEVRSVLPPRLRGSLQVDVETGEYAGDVVAVVVRVPMSAASPDLLWPVGYGLGGRTLVAETRMIRE